MSNGKYSEGCCNRKLKEAEFNLRFSYVPKEIMTRRSKNVDARALRGCTSGSDESSSTHKIDHVIERENLRINKSDVKLIKPKSAADFSLSTNGSLSRDFKTKANALFTSSNILQYMSSISEGHNVKQAKKKVILNRIASMETFARSSPFDRRVTALTFHPKYPGILAAGSKGGEVISWNTQKPIHDFCIPGVGPGGSILSMKFHHEKQRILYTASLTGVVSQQDFLGKENMIFFDTKNFNIWFSSLDTSAHFKFLLAGDTQGFLYLANFDGQEVWKHKKRVHRNKVTHIEFSAKDPHIFATASLDHTVRIWDLRKFSDSGFPPESTHCLNHDKGVNSAYFSPSDGTSLLTTDQHQELRLYRAPLWHLQTSIAHPHRQFQHLTPIKAQWHPLEEFIVVGRYPDEKFCPNDMRSIDIYDGHTGERKHYFGSTGIVSLSAFSPTGDVLTTASGTNVTLWKPKDICEDLVKVSNIAGQKLLLKQFSRSGSRNTRKSKLSIAVTEKKVPEKKKRSH